ncbi:MAG: SpoIIE family protein phosphatase [Bacteroidetes bacterium]|nr:SpoIIE family protein phosphatase [Bacteroidota bacterium]
MQSKTNELEAKYETEKKELQIKSQTFEIETKEKQNKQKSFIILFGTLALVGTGFFAAIAFINFKKTKKQNLIIENQKMEVELKNEEITHQKELVDEKQKEIIDSINYAKRIQQAVLTGEDVWNKISKEHFILFKPKDIVSGDFYWAYNTPNNRSVFCLADCTGHGVPGGFMSMLGNSFLNEIVVENKIFKADQILNKLRSKIIHALEQKGGTQQKDGMDMSLCVWNKLDNTLEFAGANNPLWLVRKNENAVTELVEVKADKMPIGLYLETETPFSSVTIQLQAGDIIYLCTDGYADQFGGPKGKKLKYKPLIESLIKNSALPMAEQKNILDSTFNDWMHKHDQVDDVSLIGVKVV